MSKQYVFKCEDGNRYICRDGSCLSCSKCSDIFYDYTNGPYAIICVEGHKDDIPCPYWEENTGVEEYKGKISFNCK